MFDYRNNLKKILNQVAGDDQSLRNGLAAIKAILNITDDVPNSKFDSLTQNKKQAKIELAINNLLTNLTTLIMTPGDIQAKNRALKAVHQLQMSQQNENYQQTFSHLEQAIKQSQTTKEVINKKVFQQALQPQKQVKRDYRKGHRYTVIRLLSGCDLVNDSNRCVFTMKESQIHDLNLKSGDIVEAVAEKANSYYEAEILRVVGFRQLPKLEVDSISTFKYAVVQGRPGHLAISRNISGKKLQIRGKNIILPVDSSNFQEKNVKIEDGAIVDLAWYDGDVNLRKNPAAAIQIRWVYDLDAPKTAKPVKKKKNHHDEDAISLAKLDMDLHYQRVGIAVGNNQNEALLESIVKRYHGIPQAIDAFEGKKKTIENQVRNLDIIILVTAFAAHDSTWNIREFASKYNVKFAVSSSKGYQAFERALYRAEKGMPAYEGNQSLEYKIEK